MAIGNCTINYLGADGSVWRTETKRYATTFRGTLITDTPTLAEHEFAWWVSEDGSTFLPGGLITATGEGDIVIELAPVWGPSMAVIRYDSNGGSAVEDTLIKGRADTDTVTGTVTSTTPTMSGREFGGWLAADGTVYLAEETIEVESGSTVFLTAMWSEPTPVTTIHYDANGGSGAPADQVDSHSVPIGTVTVHLNSDTVPTKSGWLFGGWTVGGSVKQPGDEISIEVGTEVTAIAHWYQNTAKVTYDTSGAGALEPSVVKNAQTSGTVAVTLRSDVPVKDYHVFARWTDPNGVEYRPGGTINVPYNGTVVLTAVFQRSKCTVNLVSERGQGPQTVQVDQGTNFTLPTQTDDDYAFKGWAETDGGEVKHLGGSSILADRASITLYAIWNLKFNEETITLAAGGTILLKDVTWGGSDHRAAEIGDGGEDVFLDDLGFAGVHFVPRSIVASYPTAFGIAASDMDSAANPYLEVVNTAHDGVNTVEFEAQTGGYIRGSIKLACIDIASMTGFILTCYLSQETDVTIFTVKLMKSQTDTSPVVVTGLVGSYRNPATFTFPSISEGSKVLDVWVSQETGEEYHAGDSLSLTGRYVAMVQTLTFVAKMATRATVLEFSLQGGRDGPGSITRFSDSASTFTIPSVTPTRRGYTFRGWATVAGGTPTLSAGGTVTVSAGLVQTLYASWQRSSSPFTVQGDLYAPYCGIRIWRDSTAYFNATFYQVEGGLAVISKAENRPGSATFTLANDFGTPARSLCSTDFAQWSDGGKGAIAPGMYVELLDIRSKDDASLIMDGRITTMTPNGDTVAFEVGDGITFLSKTGSWLRRNYREEGKTQEYDLNGYIESGALKVDIGQHDGTPTFPVLRYRTEEVSVPLARGAKVGLVTSTTFSGTAHRTVDGTTYSRLRKIRFKVRWDIYVEYGLATVAPVLKIVTPEGSATTHVFPDSYIYNDKGSKEFEYGLGIPFTGDVSISIQAGVSGQNRGDQYVEDCYVFADKTEEVTSSSSLYVDESPDAYDLADPSVRLHVAYEKGSVTVTTLMSEIATAIGYGVADLPGGIHQKRLAIFRVGGSFAQTYLQKLADQSEGGRAYSYSVDGASPTLRIGARYLVSDSPKYIAKFGGDTAPTGFDADVIDIADFAPKKTMKDRPNLLTLKASLDDNQSITVSFEDPVSTKMRDGLTVEKIVADSSARSIEGVGSAAYAELKSNDLDQWEGEMTLPGILWGIMSEGDPAHAGSGVPILVKDSRFGMDGLRTRARQVTYDYNGCITKVTLGNYDLRYSSGIASTNALAVEVSDMVGGISDTTLYNQQYVYVKSKVEWSPGSTSRMTIHADNGSSYALDTTQVFELPDGSHIAVGTIKADATRFLPASVSYGINSVELSGSTSVTVAIPVGRKPDFHRGQTLTVCVLLAKPD